MRLLLLAIVVLLAALVLRATLRRPPPLDVLRGDGGVQWFEVVEDDAGA